MAKSNNNNNKITNNNNVAKGAVKRSRKVQNGNTPRSQPAGLGSLGSLLGSMLGGPVGGAFGGAAGNILGRITGVGDYKVRSNTITSEGMNLSGEVPTFGRSDNSTRVRHREYIGNVAVPATPTGFNNTSYAINPSNASLFPWLSRVAENYQQYKLHGAVLVFKTTTSDYSSAGGMGKVVLATNYNVLDSAYSSEVEMENSEFAVSGKPSTNKMHPIECSDTNGVPTVKWVRDAGYDPVGGDARLYDVGKFQIATAGLPGTVGTILGELWITYDVEFFKPIVAKADTQQLYTPVSVNVLDQSAGAPGAFPIGDRSLTEYTFGSWPLGSAGALNWWQDGSNFIRGLGETKVAFSPYRTGHTGTIYSDASIVGALPPAEWPAQWVGTNVLRLQRPGVWNFNFRLELQTPTANYTDRWDFSGPAATRSWVRVQGFQGTGTNAPNVRLVTTGAVPCGLTDNYAAPPVVPDSDTVSGGAYALFATVEAGGWEDGNYVDLTFECTDMLADNAYRPKPIYTDMCICYSASTTKTYYLPI